MILTALVTQLLAFSSSEAQQSFEWNGHRYKLSKPSQYEFFQNSEYNDMTISEFTKTYCFSDGLEIHDFELLVPGDMKKLPIIHFYTMDALNGQTVSIDEFTGYRAYWKDAFTKGGYTELFTVLDSLTVCEYIASNSKIQRSSVVYEDDQRLTIWYMVKGLVGNEEVTLSVVSNFLYLDGDIIFIKANNVIDDYSSAKQVLKQSNKMVTTFLSENQ